MGIDISQKYTQALHYNSLYDFNHPADDEQKTDPVDPLEAQHLNVAAKLGEIWRFVFKIQEVNFFSC